MSTDKFKEHYISHDSIQPKPEVKSLSDLPDLSKFGLSAPYPKTLIKQIAPETIVEEEAQPETGLSTDISDSEEDSEIQEIVEEESKEPVSIDNDIDIYDYKDPNYYVGADFRLIKVQSKTIKPLKIIDDRTVWQHFWELAKHDNTKGFPVITSKQTEASKRNRKIAEKIYAGIMVTFFILYVLFLIFGNKFLNLSD